jgi:predicted ribosome quality control (RQC) complex YloA/Tae2 family protein
MRSVIELQTILNNQQLIECYTQEEDKLFIHCPTKTEINRHLIITLNPQEFHYEIKNDHHKAKKNVYNFYAQHFPQKIISVKIAFGERIIAINLEHGTLFILIRGNKTNCIYKKMDEQLLAFKKVENDWIEKFKAELANTVFVDKEHSIIETIGNIDTIDKLKSLPFISKELIQNVSSDAYFVVSSLLKLINEIIYGKIAVGINNSTEELIFKPLTMLNENENINVELFDSYLDAISKYFLLKNKTYKRKISTDGVKKYLEREIERISNKLNILKARIEHGSKEKLYREYGNHLLINIKQLRKGMKDFTVKIPATEELFIIKLNPKLSAQLNIDNYFDKSRAEKIEYDKSISMHDELKLKYEKLIQLRDKLLQDLTNEEISSIQKELKLNPSASKMNGQIEKLPYRHYIIQNKYHVFVGRDSKSNDSLTTKYAKQNDYWFHARSTSGSHIILRVENTKESIPKTILNKVASIAAFYSKSKTSKLAPVTYTLKKYVVKNKRHEPGQVSVTKEKVLLVPPEIPLDCILHDQ